MSEIDYIEARVAEYRKHVVKALHDGVILEWARHSKKLSDEALLGWASVMPAEGIPDVHTIESRCHVCRRHTDDFAPVDVCDECRAIMLPDTKTHAELAAEAMGAPTETQEKGT